MAGDSKFVQITTAVMDAGTAGIETVLFAIDNQGDVWRYHFRGAGKDKKAKWVQLSSERQK